VLSSRRAFGLNFERHLPENVELPQRPVRKGDKVRILPARRSGTKGDPRLWVVRKINEANGRPTAHLELIDDRNSNVAEAAVDDLVVIAEFRDSSTQDLSALERWSEVATSRFIF
jgi:adenine-specific DNA-methyltransferase